MSIKKLGTISERTDIPYLMSAKHLEQLGFGRTMAYELMNTEGFPVLQIGSRKMVPKDAFMAWLKAKIEEKTAARDYQYS